MTHSWVQSQYLEGRSARPRQPCHRRDTLDQVACVISPPDEEILAVSSDDNGGCASLDRMSQAAVDVLSGLDAGLARSDSAI